MRVATRGRHAGKRLSPWRVGTAVAVVAAIVAAPFVVGTVLGRQAAAEATVAGPRWFGGYFDVPAAAVSDTPVVAEDAAIVLAFVVAEAEDVCEPSWGTFYSLDEAERELDLDRRVARLRQGGADVVVSFGGAINTELASACETSGEVAAAYRDVIDRYAVGTIDLDLEYANLSDEAAGYRRAAAVAQLQRERERAGEALEVWLTLPVAMDGLTDEGLTVVRQMLSSGVDLTGVNVMTMNYNTDLGDRSMGEIAIDAATATRAQLASLYDRMDVELPPEGAWAILGVTPMIGQNDIAGEVFTLRDAEMLHDFAADHALGRMSMWSLNRDRTCGPNYPDVQIVSDSCSGIDQQGESFAGILSEGFDGMPAAPAAPTSAPTPVPDDPETSPYPIWSPDVSYSSGVRVVWHGNVYSAKWWTLGGAEPDDPTLAGDETPWTLVGPVMANDAPYAPPTVPEGTYPAWEPEEIYTAGDRVQFEGTPYVAKWWTQGDDPAVGLTDHDRSPWRVLTPTPAATPTPTPSSTPAS